MSRAPVDTARYVFDAFMQGDIPGLLACLAPDIEWEYGPVSQNVPWYQNRHGIAGVTAFFESLGACTFERFEPTAFMAADDTVAVLVDSAYTVNRTGIRVVYEDAVFVLKFDAAGKVSRLAHRVDLHQAWLAYNAEPCS